MLIRVKKHSDIAESEVTPESVYVNRRKFLGGAAGLGWATLLAGGSPAPLRALGRRPDDEPNTFEEITTYNNYYEFGTDKRSPSRNAHTLRVSPWSVRVDGLCDNPADYQLEDFIKPSTIEDRTYRLRCVEGWSMVIPWRGFPLVDVIRRASPTTAARYVQFETLWDPEEMPERRWKPRIGWPYREGLRLDEALHPLSFLATGLYGKTLPNQNGAPIRLVVPWKYGFKSIKSIVRMTFTENEPPTTWATQTPSEYGFYSNVNPEVAHPRWSQATEKRIDSSKLLGSRRIDTRFLNGYAEEVGHLYQGMDLKKYF